jgi:hypothetical protein
MGTFYPGQAPAGGTLTVLVQDPAATQDANAVYLLSAVVPANTLKAAPSGGVLIAVDGEITTKVGGAALNTTTAGLVIRNSVGGVPSTPFPAGIYTPFSQTGANGLLDNAVATVSLFGCSYTYNQADNYGSVLTMEAESNAALPDPFRTLSTFPLEDQLVAPDFTSETLWQVVLVQNFNVACIPPANFNGWASTSSQIAIFT